ncbi:MAG TPA: gluconate 2-dehydrogenase subunit 3 family protein [Paraburkholderia sp.]|jgi:gluconate 2-dehydrogenase gamma chain|nr:gluconate 2-dehydrogenase subunit 3 family protein [Paraburkholderia sp.]
MTGKHDQSDDTRPIASSRRQFLVKTVAILPAAGALASCAPHDASTTATARAADNSASSASSAPYQPTFFNPREWTLLQAAIDRLIPADAEGPGALELDVAVFIDRQMEGGFGHAATLYMQGPFPHDIPHASGFQSRMTPRDVYRAGLAALDQYCNAHFSGKRFEELGTAQKDEILHGMDAGKIKFEQVSAASFIGLLWQNTKEGYFADPIHGGNKNAGSWKMIGFPGARADFLDWVAQPGKPYPLGPVTIAGT